MGRMDIVNPYGWWEQPAAGQQPGDMDLPSGSLWPLWTRDYGRQRDGRLRREWGRVLNDVVTVLNPHGWGIWRGFEQKARRGGGKSHS